MGEKKINSDLHAGLGVSHDRKKQRQDIFSVGTSVGQTQAKNKTQKSYLSSTRCNYNITYSTKKKPE